MTRSVGARAASTRRKPARCIWSTLSRLAWDSCVSQTAAGENWNEITAALELLTEIAIEGCAVAIDAMDAQTIVAGSITERGAHHVLWVNENHQTCAIRPCLPTSIHGPLTPSSTNETTLKDNARVETLRCRAYAATDRIYKAEDCQDLSSFAVVECICVMGDRASTKRAFYVSSLPADAGRITQAARTHPEIYN